MEKGVEGAVTVIASLEVPKDKIIYPHHDMINFIVTVAYSDFASPLGHKGVGAQSTWGPEDLEGGRRQVTFFASNCPARSSDHALELLYNIGPFRSGKDISNALSRPILAREKMLAWVGRGFAVSLRLLRHCPTSQEKKRWKNGPFREHSLILGCEVTGSRRLTHPEGPHPHETNTHIIKQVDLIMVRYMFLITLTARTLQLGADTKPAMQAAFKKIAKMHEA